MSKVTLVPVPPDDIRDGLYSVIGGALAGGAPAPAWVAVDDGTDTWVVKVSKRPAAERMGCVVAAASEGALVTAQRLGIGGAMWLPPSSLGALEVPQCPLWRLTRRRWSCSKTAHRFKSRPLLIAHSGEHSSATVRWSVV